jgi:hypothetical protein
MGISLLIFVSVDIGASEPLPSKITSASVAIPAILDIEAIRKYGSL